MRKSLLSILPFLVLIYSCGENNRNANEFLNPGNISSQIFNLDGKTDTIIRTSHASLIKIRKGTFDGPASIEIKEVFTPEEIFRSGLVTVSNGQTLRSAGMIYFNATKNGETVQPALPVFISIPAGEYDTAMKVFKGEWSDDSLINWIDPQKMDTINSAADTARGRLLFNTRCATCHSPFKDLTGPPLRGLQNRGPWRNFKNIRQWINNPGGFMSKDPYTRDLKAKFGSVMTPFPDITDADVKGLLAYINSVSPEQAKNDYKALRPSYSGDDGKPCYYDTIYASRTDNYPFYDTTIPPVVLNDTAFASNIVDDTDEWEYYLDMDRQRYEFNITSNGWYNVDAFLKVTDKNGVSSVKLIAEIQSTEKAFMNVYLFIPSERVLQNSSDKKGQQYFFRFNEDGTIPLPLRYRAILFAFGTSGEKLLYGITEFEIKTEQTISLELKETTKEGFQYLLQSKNINGVNLEPIEKTRTIQPVYCDTALKDANK